MLKKVAIVISIFGRLGGAEKVAADLILEFYHRHYDVTVITFGRQPPKNLWFDVPCRMLNLNIPEREGGFVVQVGIMLKRAWHFRRIFRLEKYDHIFSFLEAANLPTVLASTDAVLSTHTDPDTMTRKQWLAFRWFYPRARKVITVSRQMQHLLEVEAGLNNVCCIYNPVDTQFVRKCAREPLAISSRFIVAVGRLVIQKRFDLLLEAFAKTRTRQECQLLIVGTGPEQGKLEKYIVDLGLKSCVSLVGFDENPYKYMARAEFQVMSSEHEGYPLVLLEALALGCPVLSTDCPTGPQEIVQHGVNGLLVEVGNTDAMTEGIDRLFFDDELREQLSQQAAQSVENNDVSVVADRWLAV